MNTLTFETREKAQQYVDGTLEWEFGGDASFDGLVNFVYYDGEEIADNIVCDGDYDDEISYEDQEFIHSSIIAQYLLSVNENPENYSINV